MITPIRPIRMPIIPWAEQPEEAMTALDYLRDPDAIYAQSFELISGRGGCRALPAAVLRYRTG